jgi:hypothetical protein
MTLINGNNKSVVPYTGVPTVPPPPPPPKNPILEFKNLVAAFEVQRKDFETLKSACEKRVYPVAEFLNPNEIDQSACAQFSSDNAKRLLEKLQALWPEENIHHHASYQYIALRLGVMMERLPKGEQSDVSAKSLIERIEAELPSITVLESTCRELEDNEKKFPLATDILPVLKKQKKIWAERMAAVDVVAIEKLGEDWDKAHEEQHAIFEKSVRERIAFAGHKELLALLDVDPDVRVEGCAHYVLAIDSLLRENCTELADKLRHCLGTYQDFDYERADDDALKQAQQAHDELRPLYVEAYRVAEEKRSERECKERLQAYEERKREAEETKRRTDERISDAVRQRERERAHQHQLLIEEKLCDALVREQEEWWGQIATEYDPWLEVSAETIAEIKSSKLRVKKLTNKDLAKLREKSKQELAKLAELQAKKEYDEAEREEMGGLSDDELRDILWKLPELDRTHPAYKEFHRRAVIDQRISLPDLQHRIEDQDDLIRELQQRISDLEGEVAVLASRA